jgi:hypothetical protein
VQTKAARQQATVQLIQALGGSWKWYADKHALAKMKKALRKKNRSGPTLPCPD